ncbi:HAD family hydrolase [Clostridium sardiniense]|uniref:HAD family hydrolase n=1 Tax=Clostridium sardiniense TaxID=29369 RepID=A0ABS7KU47_CLOSR|nr:HAD family hydrolase [Clostridium sardiniense]MBY0754182.1 HAD family hydrolase [Clostridium sardiniense]MDQ0459291.1 HAD superfamily hydrolase (TIGR01549 family) [Clostridium sardiniense]
MRYSHVVFDIDGTLIDSESAVLKSLQRVVLEEKGIRKKLDELRFSLGIPGKNTLEKLDIEDLKGVEEKWNNYLSDYADEIVLFVQVREIVQALKSNGIKLGIITSKTKKEYEDDFLKFGLHPYFDVVVCADDTKKHKPNGDPMEKYLEIANVKRSNVIYIGDSIYDMQCAKNAGVDSALALWGANDSECIEATYKLKEPKEILDVLI